MQYTPPNTVTSPRDCVSNINVIFDGGTGSSPFSVAKLDWDGAPCIAMRWNVGQREWDDPEKLNNQKVCAGMPVSRGFPVWFVLPKELLDENSEVWKQIKSKL
jgi:hypothetical protein